MSELSANSNSLNESEPPTTTDSKPRCAHITFKGRRCRLPVLDTRSGLCFRHFQLSQAALAGPAPAADSAVVARELLAGADDFSSAECINTLLGNLVKQLAFKRIARPDAIALAYIGQLLLNSLPAIQKQLDEARSDAGHADLVQALVRILGTRKENKEAGSDGQPPAPSEEPFKVDWH